MSFNRTGIVDHATAFWWRPCEDGQVWIASQPINLATEASKRKLAGWGGIFLWYSTAKLEGLFLLPNSKIPSAKDKLLTDFPEAVMLASYMDHPADEKAILDGLKLKPPYHGLNDCTHFTSECLAKGGFAVTNEHARRGASDLYAYLYYHKSTKVLASEVGKAHASAVIGSGLLQPGDVIVFTNRSDHQRHHGVVYLGGGKIAMHTFHQFNRDWEETGGVDQLYSLFHLSLDDTFTPWAVSRWVGWWEISSPTSVRYSYLSADGHMATQTKKPTSTTTKPKGSDYWFADASKMRTCLRAKGIVEEFTMSAFTAGSAATTAKGKRLNDGFSLLATKL